MGNSTQKIPKPPDTIEQRRSERKQPSQPTPIELIPGREMWIHDLSEGGVCVSGTSRLQTGSDADLRFQLPGTPSILAAGTVAWSEDSGRAGLRFTQMQSDSTAALRRWLKNGNMPVVSAEPGTSPQIANELTARMACLREVADLQAIVSSENLGQDDALDLIARRMAELTRATGSAIALRDCDEVLCRARFGNAPAIGATISSSSLSGECLSTGAIVTLDDSETDGRVSAEVCRDLNFRSLLILPVMAGNQAIGIAEVFSPNPRNFEGGDVLVLSFIADLIAFVATRFEQRAAELLQPETSPADGFPLISGTDAESSEALAAIFQNFDASAGYAQPEIGVAEIPLTQTESEPESLAVEEIQPEPLSAPTFSAIETALVEQSTETMKPVAYTPAAAEVAEPVVVRREASAPSIAASKRRPLAFYIVAIFLLLGIAALGLVYYLRQGSRATTIPKPAPTPVVQQSALPSSAATQSSAPPVAVDTVAVAAAIRASKAVAPKPAQKAATEEATDTQTTLQVLHASRVKPDASTPIAELPVPSLQGLGAGDFNAIASGITAVKTDLPELAVDGTNRIQPAKLSKSVNPRYPENARRVGLRGIVLLNGVVGKDGKLHFLKAEGATAEMRNEALSAVAQWRYVPAMLNGKPVESPAKITVAFTPPRGR